MIKRPSTGSSRSTPRSLLSLASCILFAVTLPNCDGAGYNAVVVERPVAVISPLADASSIEAGTTVLLDGSASHLGAGAEGRTLSYYWSLSSSPVTSTLSDDDLIPVEGEASSIEFTPDQSGIFAVTLQVHDGNDASDRAHVMIEVGGGNLCPVADAGHDLSAEVGIPITLDGTASSDPDAAALAGDDDDSAADSWADLSFSWHLTLVPPDSELTDSDIFYQGTASPLLVADVPGTYIVQLRVDDGNCTSAPDYLTILADSGNLTPIADAGESVVLSPCSPTEVVLDGSSSYDPEGQPLNFQWELTSVPNSSTVSDAVLEGRYTANPRFNWDVPGIYTLRVSVDDGENRSSPDYVAVQAVPHEPNQAPVADGGNDVVIEADAACSAGSWGTSASCAPCSPRTLSFDGNRSRDPEGDPLSFRWDLISGDATLQGADSDVVEVSIPELAVQPNGFSSANVEIGLTVHDCQGADTTTIHLTFNCHGS
tara:strand:- start:2746 stop:4197 length:1452 start_codon:yes stop_codon:yes gene_type:complete